MTESTAAPRQSLAETLLASAKALQAVNEGQSLSDVLGRVPASSRGATQAITFHVLRHLGQAREVKEMLVPKTPPVPLLDALLQVSLCVLDTAIRAQALAHDGKPVRRDWPVYAVHTVVDQSVEAVAGHRPIRSFKALMNGVLRRFTRERSTILTRAHGNPEARWNHPNWWVRHLRKAWPDEWKAILEVAGTPPPLTLRVNTRRVGRSELLRMFSEAGVSARPDGEVGVILEQPLPVQDIPGFTGGLWSVQDASAQLAAPLLNVQSGMRVLDACAAPGGKTAHLLEMADIDLLAVDSDPLRLDRVAQNLERLQLLSGRVRLLAADASRPETWWDGQLFDAILADVPCTGSGVVRRHPDIRWLRRETDIARTAALQRRIVKALWKTLKPGGHFLYVTCSVFPQEGEEQAAWLLEQHPDAIRLDAPGQLLPLDALGGDGFFYALFAKQDSVVNNKLS